MIAFASQMTGSVSLPHTLTVTSNAAAAISVSVIAGGNFAQANTCGGSLAPGSQCAVSVAFTPTAVGAQTGTLTITDRTDGSQETVALSGTGTALTNKEPMLAVGSSAASIALPTAGMTTGSDIQVRSQSDFSGIVNLSCEVVPETGVLSPETPTCSLSAMQVQVSPSSIGLSRLAISRNPSGSISAQVGTRQDTAFSLAGVALLGLIPAGCWRKRIYGASLVLIAVAGMSGCGYVQNSPAVAASNAIGSGAAGGISTGSTSNTGQYIVRISASSGNLVASTSIPIQ
jgi:hypothetical protein